MFQSEDQHVLLKDSARCIPRYLFRAFSDQSRGINSATETIPDASCYNTTTTADEKLISNTKQMISDHLLYKYSTPSEFSSWSSSLLFVLRHAIRKAHRLRPQDTNVSICILDTTTLPDHRPIYPATALMAAYGIKPIVVRPYARNDKRNWLVPHYYLGEYLLHGPLSLAAPDCAAVKMQAVSLDCLEQTGLYYLLPALNKTTSSSLAPEVRALRRVLSGRDAQLEPLLPVHIGAFSTLGRLFGTTFALPVTVAFLTLRRWERWPSQLALDAILHSFDKEYGGPKEAGPERLDWENGDGLAITDEMFVVTEARMLRRLMQDLVARTREKEEDSRKKTGGYKLEIVENEMDPEDLSCLIGDVQLSSQESEANIESETTSKGLKVQDRRQMQCENCAHSTDDTERETRKSAALPALQTPIDATSNIDPEGPLYSAVCTSAASYPAAETSLSATLGRLATSADSLGESFRNLVLTLQPEAMEAALSPLPRDIVLKELQKSREALKSLSEASGRLVGLLGQDLE